MEVATSLNSSSVVCLAAHSSSVTYLHPDQHVLAFFVGVDGNCSFFVILCEVIDNRAPLRLLALGKALNHHGGQRANVSLQVDASRDGSRSHDKHFAVAVFDGVVALTALDICGIIFATTILTSEGDNGGVGGVANRGHNVTRCCHRECAWA